MSYENLIFVDCEARGPSPVNGTMTEFGAVHYTTRDTFYGQLFESTPDPDKPVVPVPGKRLRSDKAVASDFSNWIAAHTGGRATFVSDNPAYDWQWIAALFACAGFENPFGYSARRIGDFWAGLNGKWSATQDWKKLRTTKHTHNPVDDAMGNAEAFAEITKMATWNRVPPLA